MALFHEFHRDSLPIHNLNFGTIILLPKGNEAKQIQQYRPIYLLNVRFKIFTKVVTNQIALVAQKVIRPSQMAFLLGRNIMEGAVVLYETMHEIHRKTLNGSIFKIQFEKAYEKVKWDFNKPLRTKGFSHTWCSWIKTFIHEGFIGIKVNDQVSPYFQTKKGLRQGDPLSPILFDIVVDMLVVIIARAKEDGQIHEVVPYLIENGLSILQYADDTILKNLLVLAAKEMS